MRPAFLDCDSPWIDATLAALTPRQRIAQLLHVASWSNRGEAHRDAVLEQIDSHGIGGVIFFQGDPEQQWDFTAAYQAASRVPLLISVDAEWGLAMRLLRTVQLPYAMTLGAVDDDELIRRAGAELGRHCRRLGVHMNFAPTVDINTEPDNPVIGFRSFGCDPREVGRRAAAFALGMQDEGVLAVAKHFPGHGDTKVDSHLGLPVLEHDRRRLDAVELVPFRELIEQGVAGIMTAHLRVPALDPEPNVGATLSRPMAWDLLQQELGFEGLVITDALDMQGVAAHFTAADINRRALLAGNDLLLFCVDVPGSLDAIEAAVAAGRISQDEIDRRVRKLLRAKAWLGLGSFAMPPRDGLIAALNPPDWESLEAELAAAAVCHVHGPLGPLRMESCATLALWAPPPEQDDGLAHHQLTATSAAAGALRALPSAVWQSELAALGCRHQHRFDVDSDPTLAEDLAFEALLSSCEEADEVVVGLHGLHMKASFGFGITPLLCARLDALLATGKVTLCVFGNGHALAKLPDVRRARRLLVAWQDSAALQRATAAVLTGAAPARGQDHLGLGAATES